MGQKNNPISLRVGVNNRSWISTFYSKKKNAYANAIQSDFAIRRYVSENFKNAQISQVKIERIAKSCKITLVSARIAEFGGKKAFLIDGLKKCAQSASPGYEIVINFAEVKRADGDAILLAKSAVKQIENRSSVKRVMKKMVQAAMRVHGTRGVKVVISGRLGGAEIARSEKAMEGSVPLHTLDADIGYASEKAETIYGVIGVKVWLCKGFMNKKKRK